MAAAAESAYENIPSNPTASNALLKCSIVGLPRAGQVTATTSKLLYTLMWDNSMLADDAAKEKDKASRTTTFTRALQNMKTLAEGGTLAPK